MLTAREKAGRLFTNPKSDVDCSQLIIDCLDDMAGAGVGIAKLPISVQFLSNSQCSQPVAPPSNSSCWSPQGIELLI